MYVLILSHEILGAWLRPYKDQQSFDLDLSPFLLELPVNCNVKKENVMSRLLRKVAMLCAKYPLASLGFAGPENNVLFTVDGGLTDTLRARSWSNAA